MLLISRRTWCHTRVNIAWPLVITIAFSAIESNGSRGRGLQPIPHMIPCSHHSDTADRLARASPRNDAIGSIRRSPWRQRPPVARVVRFISSHSGGHVDSVSLPDAHQSSSLTQGRAHFLSSVAANCAVMFAYLGAGTCTLQLAGPSSPTMLWRWLCHCVRASTVGLHARKRPAACVFSKPLLRELVARDGLRDNGHTEPPSVRRPAYHSASGSKRGARRNAWRCSSPISTVFKTIQLSATDIRRLWRTNALRRPWPCLSSVCAQPLEFRGALWRRGVRGWCVRSEPPNTVAGADREFSVDSGTNIPSPRCVPVSPAG